MNNDIIIAQGLLKTARELVESTEVDSIGNAPRGDDGEHEPVASKTASNRLLDSVLPMKEVAKLRKNADKQTYALARDVYRELMNRFEPSREENEAINRLSNASSSTDEGVIRNQVFKAAHTLGMKLPSMSF